MSAKAQKSPNLLEAIEPDHLRLFRLPYDLTRPNLLILSALGNPMISQLCAVSFKNATMAAALEDKSVDNLNASARRLPAP